MMNEPGKMHPQDTRNLIIFALLSLLLWYGFDHYIVKPHNKQMAAVHAEMQKHNMLNADAAPAVTARDREAVIADAPRVKIDNGVVFGSLALRGGRIDDLRLRNYYTTMENTENVVLLSPAGSPHAKYAEFGWMPAGGQATKVPDQDSTWRMQSGDTLAVGKPVTLAWSNGAGLRFERRYEVDDRYMISVTQRVTNETGAAVTLYPYALVSQMGLGSDFYGHAVVHEGPIAYLDGELHEKAYKKMNAKNPAEEFKANAGWIGISDKYWFVSLIPGQDGAKTFRFLVTPDGNPKDAENDDKYQTDVVGAPVSIEAGQSTEISSRFFAGAKEVKTLAAYEKSLSIEHFDLAVDFGLYYFLTKPFFYILDFFGRLFGNFGVAILCLTVIVRLAVYPLASTSYRSFAHLKKIAPEMKELREKHGDDKQKLQAGLVKLYEKEKVNPMAGCLPILIQIPIFFALYKVLSITIEMRHAPFFGWIQDLSAHDPLTVFNLFGLIPWEPPMALMIGPWSILMLVAMLVQRQMNPPPQDPAQAIMINVMPFMITYMLAKFPAGLVIYWTFSNILSIAQQYIIMRSVGVEVHLFKRDKKDKEMEKMVLEGPSVHPELKVVEDQIEEALTGHDDEPKSVSKPKPKKKKKK